MTKSQFIQQFPSLRGSWSFIYNFPSHSRRLTWWDSFNLIEREFLKYLHLPALSPSPYMLWPAWESNVSKYTTGISNRWHRISFNTLLNTHRYPQRFWFRGLPWSQGWSESWGTILSHLFHGLLCDLQQAIILPPPSRPQLHNEEGDSDDHMMVASSCVFYQVSQVAIFCWRNRTS